MKPFRIRRAAAVLAVALALFVLIQGLHQSGVRFNLSGSEPLGFYLMEAFKGESPIPRGSLIEFCPDVRQQDYPFVLKGQCHGGTQPFLKHVIGVPGDTVRETDEGVWINGLAIAHSKPRNRSEIYRITLPRWRGRVALGHDQFWVYGSGDPLNSFDSRYFGPIRAAQIITMEKQKVD